MRIMQRPPEITIKTTKRFLVDEERSQEAMRTLPITKIRLKRFEYWKEDKHISQARAAKRLLPRSESKPAQDHRVKSHPKRNDNERTRRDGDGGEKVEEKQEGKGIVRKNIKMERTIRVRITKQSSS